MRKIVLGEEFVERSDRTGLIEFVGALGEINFGRFAEGRVNECDSRGVQGSRDLAVATGPGAEFVERVTGR